MACLFGWVLLAPLVAACSGHDRTMAPTGPTAVPAAAPVSSAPFIRAIVQDSAFRPLAGARVEALDGASAGAAGVADGNGVVTVNGTFTSGMQFRATHNGHESVTQTWSCNAPACGNNAQPWLYYQLRPDAPALDLAGEYTITLTAASSCTTLPQESRSRSYAASLTPRLRAGTADVLGFRVWLHADDVLDREHHIGVAGNYMTLYLTAGDSQDEPAIVEHLGDSRYVAFAGSTTAPVNRASLANIAVAFDGAIEHLELRHPLPGRYVIGPGEIISQQRCESSEHRLLLVRR